MAKQRCCIFQQMYIFSTPIVSASFSGVLTPSLK